MILISCLIGFVYVGLISTFIYGFDKNKSVKLENYIPKSKFSVIIPFRNEAENLPRLINAILSLNYPKHIFEVLFIDDNSEDDSYKIALELTQNTANVTLLKSVLESKKEAIKQAIETSQYNWIITSDADCKQPNNWLACFDAYIQENAPKMIAGPIKYETNNSFLESFQALDLMSLLGATIAAFGLKKPFLCNGANLCYSKEIFNEVNGFKGNEHIASGDDIFLLNKVSKNYPNSVHYLFSDEAIVTTYPEKSVSALVSQRIRWSAKTTVVNDNFTKLIGLIVLLMNLAVIYMLFQIHEHTLIVLLFISAKSIIDYILIKKVALFLKETKDLNYYVLSILLYPMFSIFIAITSIFSGYSWKGRSLKK